MKTEYAFDFSRPDAVPEVILQALEAHGIRKKDVLLLVRADLSRDRLYCDGYLLFTARSAAYLEGISSINRAGRAFIESRYAEYERSSLRALRVSDYPSISALEAEYKGEKILLSYFTKTLREDFLQFAKYADELLEKGSFTPEKEGSRQKKELYCPKCGLRYADPDAKICPKCQKRTSVIKRTLALFGEYKVKLLLVTLALVAGSAMAIVTPYISTGFFYDKVLSDDGSGYYGRILLALLMIAATRVLSALVSSCHSVLTARLAADMSYKLRYTIFSAINRLSLSFFTSRKTGGLMTQVDNDADTIYWFFCEELPQLLISGVQVLSVSVVMFIVSPLLALFAVVVLPLAAVLTVKLFGRMDVLYGRRYRKRSSLNSALSDMLGGIRVVKAFSGERHEKKRFAAKSAELAAADVTVSVYNAKTFPFLTLLMRLGSVLVWAVGGVLILGRYATHGLVPSQSVLTYGMLATFLSYVTMVYEPLFSFADTMTMAADSMNAMGRLIEIMDARPDVTEKENALSPSELKGDVTFEDVGFSYVPGVPVLEKVSFTVPEGTVTGIVGRTGAGKTTLMNLLTRLYDPNEGRILIGGIDLRDLSFECLKKNVAIVSQDTYLFSGSILENVRYARPDATLQEVMDACVAAGANEFIMKLRDGYDTRIGQGNADLSGGEKQRLSIARAILKDPKILILDEATSAMDTRTERMIQEALEVFMKGRTTLMIAHRLSTLRSANELVVIDRKTVAEQGEPEELIKKKGLYYELYKLQVESMKNVGLSEDE